MTECSPAEVQHALVLGQTQCWHVDQTTAVECRDYMPPIKGPLTPISEGYEWDLLQIYRFIIVLIIGLKDLLARASCRRMWVNQLRCRQDQKSFKKRK